jgi:chromosome segregation ATPase
MLRLVLADVRDIKARVAALEAGQAALQATVDDRLRDTRPLWQEINARTERIEEGQTDAAARLDRVEARLDGIEQETRTIRRDIGFLREDIRNERIARAELAERVEELERRPN